eukprot:TRINITY_DN44767_c0_g1_i1.p1 TRINITY_DN44767_c0_g1~~TRINITY_DN44767_c0_g1_i1.p1  ORF type:complete len:604 (+),score=176.59 TRINITY_DN44767_c0_g1_i1:127-1812(+)
MAAAAAPAAGTPVVVCSVADAGPGGSPAGEPPRPSRGGARAVALVALVAAAALAGGVIVTPFLPAAAAPPYQLRHPALAPEESGASPQEHRRGRRRDVGGTAQQLRQRAAGLRAELQRLRAAAPPGRPCPATAAGGAQAAGWFAKLAAGAAPSFGDPPPSTSTVSSKRAVCLPSRGGDRFGDPRPWRKGDEKEPGWGDLTDGVAFIVLDLCRMGHQPKDAALLDAYLQEGARVDYLLYGNRCISRSPARQSRKQGIWHPVLRGWFEVALSAVPASRRPRPVFIEDYPRGVCVGTLVRRPHFEPFRWFRTQRQAASFRARMLRYWGVPDPPAPRSKPSVLLLRRGIERHFGEDALHAQLQSALGSAADLRYVQFDGDANPRGTGDGAERVRNYTAQLRLLAGTDVLLAAHGAALSSLVALPRGAVLIEVFPHNFRYNMYAELAWLSGVSYSAAESREIWGPAGAGCSGCRAPPAPMDVGVPEHVNGLRLCNKGLAKCTPPCKKCDAKVDWPQWAQLLQSALLTVRHSPAGSFRALGGPAQVAAGSGSSSGSSSSSSSSALEA